MFHLGLEAMPCDFDVLWIQFDSDEVSSGLDGDQCRRAGTHEWIKDYPAFWAPSQDTRLNKFFWERCEVGFMERMDWDGPYGAFIPHQGALLFFRHVVP